jgi:hypothetical protein
MQQEQAHQDKEQTEAGLNKPHWEAVLQYTTKCTLCVLFLQL